MSPRRQVYKPIQAQKLEVCHSGAATALHLETERGPLQVLLSTQEFLRAKNADRDYNGNPWPRLNCGGHEHARLERAWEMFAASPHRSLEEIGDELGLCTEALSNHFSSRHGSEYARLRAAPGRAQGAMPEHLQALIQAAFHEHESKGTPVPDLAMRLGVTAGALRDWFGSIRSELSEAVRDRRAPARKPGGKIL